MKYTPNLNLKKPDYTDLADIPAHFNGNMDTIDAELKENADAIADVGTELDTHGTQQSIDLEKKVDKVIGKGLSDTNYTALEKVEVAKISTIETNVGALQTDLGSHKEDYTTLVTEVEGKADIEPIASYTYNGNLEIAPTTIDIATGTFTKTAHGLINGDRIFPTMNLNAGDSFQLSVYPTGLTQASFYVVDSTIDTFKVSLTSGGTPIIFTGIGNLTKWHFEKWNLGEILIIDLPARSNYRVVFKGKFSHTDNFYLRAVNGNWNGSNWTLSTVYSLGQIGTGTLFMYLESFLSTKPVGVYRLIGEVYNQSSATTNARTPINQTALSFNTNLDNITSISARTGMSCRIANGSTLEVYDI